MKKCEEKNCKNKADITINEKLLCAVCGLKYLVNKNVKTEQSSEKIDAFKKI
tara:strand:- start:2415 stop:2570 length:156 start_codon:yes stop_codon:yes gene_type:complete